MWAMGPVYGFSVVRAEYAAGHVRRPCPPEDPWASARCAPRWSSPVRFRARRWSPGDPTQDGGVRRPHRPGRRARRRPNGGLRAIPGAGPASHAAPSVGVRARYISRNSEAPGRWPVARERRWNRRTQTSRSRWPSGRRRSVNKVEGIPRENSLPAVPSPAPQADGHGGKRFPRRRRGSSVGSVPWQKVSECGSTARGRRAVPVRCRTPSGLPGRSCAVVETGMDAVCAGI